MIKVIGNVFCFLKLSAYRNYQSHTIWPENTVAGCQTVSYGPLSSVTYSPQNSAAIFQRRWFVQLIS